MDKIHPKTNAKAWVVAVDMGYGHQRTAYPLKDIAFGNEIINANSYEGIDPKDKKIWQTTKSSYEFVSRFKKFPLLGGIVFFFLNRLQKILTYYPKRDLSGPSLNVRAIFSFIKKGWGRDLIEKIQNPSLPLISTFFTPAFMAEEFSYQNDIYCVVCDADIARAWVALDPKKSKIKYFAPCTWARDRLKLYGIRIENIYLTGYPLPKENIGGENMEILKKDVGYRILNLDPFGRYRKLYKSLLNEYLGEFPESPDHPLTLMFSIGGAGAQKEIGLRAINSLSPKIRTEKIKVIVAVGIRKELKDYFSKNVKDIKLDGQVQILSADNVNEYFKAFNQALRKTDVLWTKPSEVSFYAGLGIPVIIAPSIGSQEDFNKKWLLHVGAGILQENPKYTDHWFFDFLNAGDFAEIAMQGFVEIEKMGTYNIEKIIVGSTS